MSGKSRSGIARRIGPWLLAAGSGGAVSLAWAPFHAVPLVFLGMTALLAVTRDVGRGRRFLLAWLAGAIAFGTAFYWVYETMREMSGLSAVLAALAVGLYAALHGLLWAFFALFAEPLRRASAAALPRAPAALWLVTGPALWVALEWLFPFLFPIYVGYGMWGALPLVQVSDLAGAAGPSFVVLCVAAGLAEAFARWREDAGREDEGRAFARSRWRRAWRPLAAAGAVLVGVTLYGVVRIAQVEGAPESARLRVALVQHLPTLAEKRSSDAAVRYHMLQRAIALTEAVASRAGSIDVVVWPEGAFPYYLPDFDDAADRPGRDWRSKGEVAVRSLARAIDTDLVLGSLRRAGDRTRNAAAFLPKGGGPTAVYDKVVLVAFGEYMPLSDTFPSLRNLVTGIADLQAGEGHAWFRLAGHDALVTICYEAILPGFVRNGLAERGEWILNLTNDVWFGRSRGLDLHLMGQALRTVENRVPLVRATTTGISAFVDATGRLYAHTGKQVLTVLEGDVVLRDVTSVYRAVGDLFLALVVAFAAAVAGIGGRRLAARRETSTQSLRPPAKPGAAELPATGAVGTGARSSDMGRRGGGSRRG